ncbi:hypothetical protein [Nocardia brasiliensis]|uniref:hypothetical protein n=1 Tax=Nocardia brasiliensis TaxID=37326 RepID=UPI002453FBEF|nr:hypothetical protein [Nocardia brasiliensis]
MSDTREALKDVFRAEYAKLPPGEYPTGRALIDAILAEFLVIPRSEITGTEYGWRTVGRGVMKVDSRDEAIETARGIRELRRGRGEPHDVEAIERPALPWSVIPLPECPSIAMDVGHAWQADVDTPPGVVGCAVCPATTQWPLPEDGDTDAR